MTSAPFEPDDEDDLLRWGMERFQNEHLYEFEDPGEGNQREHLERVSSKIALTVLAFCRLHNWFHAADLRTYVVEQIQVAPASPDRILRDLRQRGWLDYEVADRRASYYHVTWVREHDDTSSDI